MLKRNIYLLLSKKIIILVSLKIWCPERPAPLVHAGHPCPISSLYSQIFSWEKEIKHCLSVPTPCEFMSIAIIII